MPSEPPSRPADRLHDYVGFVRSRLHEELAVPGLHHSTRRALQRRLTRVGEIADQADGTTEASLLSRAANGVELVDLARRWREHPDYPGTRTTQSTLELDAPEGDLPASVSHVYERGLTADLLAGVGGYPGLHEEARTELAEQHPCCRVDPGPPVPVTVTSDDAGFLTVRAEICCTDRACRIEAAAVARYEPLLDAYDRAREQLRAADLLLRQPNLAATPDPAQLSAQWSLREKAIREALGAVIDILAPHAAPATE